MGHRGITFLLLAGNNWDSHDDPSYVNDDEATTGSDTTLWDASSVEGYVYSPLTALALSPLVDATRLEELWTAAQLAAALLACLLGSLAVSRDSQALMRAFLFLIAGVTLLSSWTMTVEIWLGQVTVFVLTCLTIAMYAAAKRIVGLAGFALGMAALVKTWPAALLVWVVRAPRSPRVGEWAAVGVLAVGALVLALSVGGLDALRSMVTAPLESSSQDLVAFSSWGAAELLFSDSGMSEPLVASPLLQIATAIVLSALVLALLTTALQKPGDAVVALPNIAFCVVLLLPVSHYPYLILPLPALWWWSARAVAAPRDVRTVLVAATLLVWWYLALRRTPSGGLDTATDLRSFLIVFGSTLAAAFSSIIGAAGLGAVSGDPSASVEARPLGTASDAVTARPLRLGRWTRRHS